MSNEGIRLVARAALILYLIVVGTVFRALVGSSKRRGQIMLIGTLGGLAVGVLVASLLSRVVTRCDVLDICAPVGMTVGWAAAWLFARRIPREAS
jgi:hypothetical protein